MSLSYCTIRRFLEVREMFSQYGEMMEAASC